MSHIYFCYLVWENNLTIRILHQPWGNSVKQSQVACLNHTKSSKQAWTSWRVTRTTTRQTREKAHQKRFPQRTGMNSCKVSQWRIIKKISVLIKRILLTSSLRVIMAAEATTDTRIRATTFCKGKESQTCVISVMESQPQWSLRILVILLMKIIDRSFQGTNLMPETYDTIDLNNGIKQE